MRLTNLIQTLTIEQRLASKNEQIVVAALHQIADMPEGEGRQYVSVVKALVMSTKSRDAWLVGKEALWAHDMDAYMDVESNHPWGEFTTKARDAKAAHRVVVGQNALICYGD